MCWINWFINISSWNIRLLQDMNEAIKHRWPDNSDTFFDEVNEVWMWHVRLSIIDRSSAWDQPMYYDKLTGACNSKYNSNSIGSTNLSIVYNGEIYNFAELKDDLLCKWYNFSSNTDTEVILASYQEWWEDCVKKFNGMWAFCIYDSGKNKLMLSRDITGEKPLFYYYNEWSLIFSSELKWIMKHKLKLKVSDIWLDLYNSLSFIPSPYSIFENIFKLEPRHNLIYDIKDKSYKTYRYYEFPKFNPIYDKKKLILEWKKIIENSVKLRMVSDVPVWAFLSWWIDSSTTTHFMKMNSKNNIHTFSIWFKNYNEDETSNINIIKSYLKTLHHHEYFIENDYKKYLDKIEYNFDEPLADTAIFSNLKVAELAKQHVSVSLTWDWWDEIFWWYNKHKLAAKVELLQKVPAKIRKFILGFISFFKKESDFSSLWKVRELLRLSLTKKERFFIEIFPNINYYSDHFKKWSISKMKEMLSVYWNLTESVIKYDLFFNSLSDRFLQKVDRSSMTYSLECRAPFLDKELIEYSCRIPTKWKTNWFWTKIILKEIMKWCLPEIILKWEKKWFWTPLKSMIKNYYWKKMFFKDNDVSMRDRFLNLWKNKYIIKKN